MKLTFLGASRNVTGSRFLLEAGGKRLLVDCGLYQERQLQERNWVRFPVDPKGIDMVLLTHAHIDHCGYLPKLVKEGFSGKILCTPPTVEITKLSLLDAAKLQEADAAYKRKRHRREKRKGPFPEVPLYTTQDAIDVFDRLQPIEYEQSLAITDTISVTYYNAGHILGAAMLALTIKEGGRQKRIVFSGDIGRFDRTILQDPHMFDEADDVIMEATYGDRLHEDEVSCSEKLKQVIQQTHERGGNIVVPTFAIGRAQDLLFEINRLLKEKAIGPVKVFVDSPMAASITQVFERYPALFDEETRHWLEKHEKLFAFPDLEFTADVSESQAINGIRKDAIIMAGSGMCNGGRIKHHLLNNIERPECTILFVGYQAAGTLGRQILEKAKQVRIFGEIVQVNAKIEKINGFSAHGDRDELLRWITGLKQAPKKVFIVHSEEKTAMAFAGTLGGKINSEIHVPDYLDTFDL